MTIDLTAEKKTASFTASKQRYETMRYNRCGTSGLKLPALSLGLWHNFGAETSFTAMRDICRTAFDCGITHFDLANNYGPPPGSAEENFGKIINGDFKRYRDELIISTKAGYTMWPGPYGDWGSRKYLLASLDQSLKRMNLEYVDIFYHHRMDPETPLEETMSALDTAVKSGKALYAGISNYDAEHTRQAADILRRLNCPFIVNQVRYSILDRHIEKDGLKEAASQCGLGIITFSPLAQGLLSDRYLNGIPSDSRMASASPFLTQDKLTAERLRQLQALNDLAHTRGQTLAQMALAWLLHDGTVTSVLTGASRPEQVRQNTAALNNTVFSDTELSEIDRLSRLL